MSLTPSQLTALRSLLDRIIPADDFPGALAAGTDTYVLRHLLGDCTEEAHVLLLGLTQLDAETVARHGPHQTFATLLPTQQDALLADLAETPALSSDAVRALPAAPRALPPEVKALPGAGRGKRPVKRGESRPGRRKR